MAASSVTATDTQENAEPRLVIAIDFGTFASGYALQWRSDYKSNRMKIHVNSQWTAKGFCTFKAPTAILLNPKKEVKEFGYGAEEAFHALRKEDKPDEWFFFRNFKMYLYRTDDNIGKDMPIEGANGKYLPAIEVFSKAIEYMKKHALDHLRENGVPYPEAETKWVLTVPAIWPDPSKSVMRAAAEQAGIKSKNLTIALEPECAAIYCSQISKDQLEIKDGSILKYILAPGSVAMVVDMGGGTVDVTAVKINADSSMEHVQSSGGGPWGGMTVDDKFFTMLRELIGGRVLDDFCSEFPMEEYDLRLDFEGNKREVKPNGNKPFRVILPNGLRDCWVRHSKETNINDILKEQRFVDKGMSFSSSRLYFKAEVIENIFNTSVSEIVNYVKQSLDSPVLQGKKIDAIVVVGGFAMSGYVLEKIRDAFADRRIPVIRPQETELAVLKGAVLFGQNEAIITSRVALYTYGVAFTMEFDASKHMAESMYEAQGQNWANCVFSKHVTEGQSIKLGEWTEYKEYYPVDENQKKATVYVFASKDKNPIHTTDMGCFCIGQFDVDFPKSVVAGKKLRRAVKVALRFGGTELEVRGVVESTGKTFKEKLRLPA